MRARADVHTRTKFLSVAIHDQNGVTLDVNRCAHLSIGYLDVNDLRPIADAIMDAIRAKERDQYDAPRKFRTMRPVETTERAI